MKLKSLGYTLDIIGSKTSINPRKHNIDENKETGHRRFYLNDKGLEKFKEFILEQWENNLKNEN